MVVKAALKKLKLHTIQVELGEVEIEEELNAEGRKKLNEVLLKLGFEIIDSKKSKIIENIKRLIITLVQQDKAYLKNNLSDFLSGKLSLDYNYISNLFTEVEGTTIEQFFISQKIEKAKELLVYEELSLSEIAFELNYSSVAHLSKQFKKVTGLSPSHFKTLKEKKRNPIEIL